MSLHTLANHLQTAGRGEDKVLVHMTPHEVNGLQSLAMAHGGSLTINPETGLPEAGFLSAILPMVAGAALAATGVGAPMAALMVGGAGAAMTGSLSKGLMMGLGAYGGAGLGAGLLGGEAIAGAGLSAAGATTAAPAAAAAGAAQQVMTPFGMQTIAGAAPSIAPAAMPGVAAGGSGAQSMAGMTPTPIAAPPAPVVAPTTTAVQTGAPSVGEATSGWMDKLKSMPGKAYDLLSGSGPEADKAREDFLKQNKNFMIAGGIGALGSGREDPRKPKEERYATHQYDWNTRQVNPSSAMPGSSGERSWFGAEGGLAGLPVEQMSQQNASSDNTRYPMAFQNTPTYATPSQRPISQNVVYPATDSDTTPYSGADRSMASGGVVALAAGTPAPKLTPQEKARQDEEVAFNKTIKNFNLDSIKEPKGGFTAANTVATFKPLLDKEKNELAYTEGRLKTYVDAKGNPKAGYDDVVNYLRDRINDQRRNLQDAIGHVYDRLPRSDINFDDPKKAGVQKTNQQNEYNAVNGLLAYINGSSLKGTDFAKEYDGRLASEKNQFTESSLYADKIAPAFAKLSEFTGKDAKGNDIKGGLSALTSGWNTESARQKADVDALTNSLKAAGLMDKAGKWTPAADQYSGLKGVANSALETQTNEYNRAIESKGAAIGDFTKATARGETIGTHGISAIPIPKVEPGTEKLVIQPDGTFGPETPTPKYQKLTAGQVTATTGWDNTIKKPWEPEDIEQVYQEVAGRKPTDDEKAKLVGSIGTMQQLVAYVNNYNNTPDIGIARGAANPFTEAELQANAKYYWGREMTTGELASYKKANFKDFLTLRDTLTKSNQYVDYLNGLNETSFTKKNAPALLPASSVDISSAFNDTLGRKPTKSEYNDYMGQKISKTDLINKLKTTDEYASKFYQPETKTTTTGGTTGGTTTLLPEGGGSGLVQPISYTTPGTMTKAEMDAYTKSYAAVPDTSPYNPVQAPQYTIAGSMQNRDINAELGLTNLYKQIAQKTPVIQQGTKYDPTQGQTLANPFANTTPGLVTLKSAATPEAYIPQNPIIPSGQQSYMSLLTPEQQAILSNMQSQKQNMAAGGMTGGEYNLGGYSDGGRLLKGPGDGVSDSIPATIGDRQPARLADGEFVVPARIVSELGNGSTDAGARKLYAMMQRIQKARSKTVGRGRVAVKSGADNMLPA
jgi:hypothetical protein